MIKIRHALTARPMCEEDITWIKIRQKTKKEAYNKANKKHP